jgi:putative FmdB family regulatory protein
MPTYEYHCKACGHKLEAFQKITDHPLTTCGQCGKDALQRGPGGGIGLSFVGTGWYKTDYAGGAPAKEGGCCPCGKGKNSCTSKSDNT